MSTTTTLARRPTTFAYGNGFGFEPVVYRKDNGTLKLERVAVFRSGTFRDSAGYQNTWEGLHMRQMIDNFKHLGDNNIFSDWPVRDGHPGWLIHGLPGNGKVIGYHTDLITEKAKAPHDGVEYDYLFADFEITDPEGARSVENKTFRNRSSEIGTYVTNDEAEFWPVYMGFAYVDIPAVEGLQFSQSQVQIPGQRMYVFMDFTKETGVGETQVAPAVSAQPANAQPGQLPFAGSVTAQVYSVNGLQVTDPTAIQNHILTLEQFRKDTVEKNRVDFVAGLANANKILATQVDSLTNFAKGLTPEQFADWQKTFDDVQTPGLLGQHGGTATNLNNAAQQGTQTAADKDLEIAKAVVAQHKAAGVPVEAIKKTDSYAKLVAANQTPKL